MLNELKDDNLIIFNTPVGFNVSDVFCDFTKKDLPKIEYLLNQINWCKDIRGYQVHIGNHAWSLCMSRGEVSKILSRLVEHKIITKASNHNAGVNSNGYVMVKPYTNDNSVKKFYHVQDYLFLQKLQADKWIAKGKEHSAYIKPASTNTESVVNLQARINQLEALLIENGISIPPAMELVKNSSTSKKILQIQKLEVISEARDEPVVVNQPNLIIDELNNLNPYLKFTDVGNDMVEYSYHSKQGLITDFSELSPILNRLTIHTKFKLLSDVLNNTSPVFTFPLIGTGGRLSLETVNQGGYTIISFKQLAA
ncbi:hypothetical protein [Mucilaginibacter defluvii]|uniref:Uncharacterized protein n=1 Tax=Mucilaginibacter defluvii TaxID=1196019 RepID=A0ABP9FKR2_9SPHI